MLRGSLLYTQIWDIKPPYIFFLYAIIFSVCPSVVCVHGVTVVVRCLTTIGIYVIGSSLYSREWGYLSAFLFAVFSTTYLQSDFMASNTETYMILMLVFGNVLFLAAISLPGLKRHVGLCFSGILFSAAFLFKQPALYELCVPLLGLVYLRFYGRDKIEGASVPVSLLSLLCGFAAGLIPVIVYFAVRGGLTQFIFLSWTYNFLYVGSISAHDFMSNLVMGSFRVFRWTSVFWGMGLLMVFVLALRWRRGMVYLHELNGFPVIFTVFWFVFSFLGMATGRRFVGHYYIQLLPVNPQCFILTAWYWEEVLFRKPFKWYPDDLVPGKGAIQRAL